jgi:hypothetical protein
MLEIKPLKITREVIGFALATTNTPSSEAQLGWKILERNDGVLLQPGLSDSGGSIMLKVAGTGL